MKVVVSSSEYQADMTTSLKPFKVIYWIISGLQQSRGVRDSGCLAERARKGDEVPSPNAEWCALPSEARLAHSESGGGGTKWPCEVGILG